MYAWIWRNLPFGLPGKIVGSLLLASGAFSLLWFWVFPVTAEWVEQVLLPFDQSTIEGDWQPGDESGDPNGGDPGQDDEELPGEHDIPYETGE